MNTGVVIQPAHLAEIVDQVGALIRAECGIECEKVPQPGQGGSWGRPGRFLQGLTPADDEGQRHEGARVTRHTRKRAPKAAPVLAIYPAPHLGSKCLLYGLEPG